MDGMGQEKKAQKKICVLGVINLSTLAILKELFPENSQKFDGYASQGYFFPGFLTPARNYAPVINYWRDVESVLVDSDANKNAQRIIGSDVIFIVATGAEREQIIKGLDVHFGLNAKVPENSGKLKGKLCFILEDPDNTSLPADALTHIFGDPPESSPTSGSDCHGYKAVNADELKEEFEEAKKDPQAVKINPQGSPRSCCGCSTTFFAASALTSATLTGLAVAGILTFTPVVVAGIAASAALALVLLLIAAYARYKEKQIEQYEAEQSRFLQEQGL